jgi:hypothetical protein
MFQITAFEFFFFFFLYFPEQIIQSLAVSVHVCLSTWCLQVCSCNAHLPHVLGQAKQQQPQQSQQRLLLVITANQPPLYDPNNQSAAADIDVAGNNPLGPQHAGSAASSSNSSSSAHNQWQTCQLPELALLHARHAVLERCGLSAPDSFSTTAADSAADASTAGEDSADVRWGYLLPQLQHSSVWASAAAALDSQWPQGMMPWQ